jgi:hypothetical protein
MDIRLVPQAEIDRLRYNSCVHYAQNGTVFGYDWFLNQTAREWDVLVEGEYFSVLPLPHRSLFYQKQELYQPRLIRELALYSVRPLSAKRRAAFFEAIPDAYQRVTLDLEPQSLPPDESFSRQALPNYYLRLDREYEELYAAFDTATAESLKRSEQADLLPSGTLKPERLAEFYQSTQPRTEEHNERFHALQRLMYQVLHRGWGFASGVQTREGELLAVAFFVYGHGQALTLLSVAKPTPLGNDALTLLYNQFIHGHAGRRLVLDFNGLPANFTKGFGAFQQDYFRVSRDERKNILGVSF